MSLTISHFEGVLTVRLQGRPNSSDLYQEIKRYLDVEVRTPVIVVLDFSLTATLGGQVIKQALFRALQHHNVSKIGMFGAVLEVQRELTDLLPLLRRIRPVFTAATEADLRARMGLVQQPPERKLNGMLSYLNNKA